MDSFTEKIVAKAKTTQDRIFVWGAIISAILGALLILAIPGVSGFAPFVIVGLIFLVRFAIKKKNIEFEYTYTNGELDIDVIIARKKRIKAFTGDCKEFDIIARYDGDEYDEYARRVQKTIVAVSSLNSKDIYFVASSNKGQRLIILFEPGTKMLELMKSYIPRKVFIDE